MKKRGRGIGCMFYGIGNTGMANPSSAFVEIHTDGTVRVLTGCAEIGQGSSTILTQIVAEEVGVLPDDVELTTADTFTTPDAGVTSASRQTFFTGNAVRQAAANARRPMLDYAAEELEAAVDDLRVGGRNIWVAGNPDRRLEIAEVAKHCYYDRGWLLVGSGSYNPATTKLDPETGQGVPYPTYAFATQIVDIEVDTETGEIEVLNVVVANDVGRAVNPKAVEGQQEGGVAMGLGYGLMEEVILRDGKTLTPGFTTYLLPTTLDVPPIEPIIVEDYEPAGPFGAKGVGEPALIPTAAAIANALYDATGVRMTQFPMTAERVLAALQAAGEAMTR